MTSVLLVAVTLTAAFWWGATHIRAVPEQGCPPPADDTNLFAGLFFTLAVGGPVAVAVLAVWGLVT
jgi:hypothetical protein